MLPKFIGGTKEESKPALVVAIGTKKPKSRMPSMIGGSRDEEEPEGSEESMSNEEAMDVATEELIDAISQVKPNKRQVKEALRAFFYACDASPHDEGEHTEDEGEEERY